MKSRRSIAIGAIVTSFLLVGASPAFAGAINGSGATFAAPLIDSCKVDFAKDSGHTVNYTGGGSGKGRSDFTGNLVDFAFITGELNADLEDLGDEIGFSISATILKPEKRDASILHHNLTQTPISILSFL